MADERIKKLLVKELKTQRKKNLQYQNINALSQLIRLDRQLLKLKLKSLGFFIPKVHSDPIKERSLTNSKTLIYSVMPGPQYRVQSITLQLPIGIDIPKDAISIQEGSALLASSVLTDLGLIKAHLANNYCLYEIQVNYDAVLHHSTQTVSLTYLIKESPSVVIDQIEINGLQTLDTEFIRQKIPLKSGDCFKRKLINQTKSTLLQLGLFTFSNIDIASPNNGQVDLTINLIERPHRTRKIGIGFDSDQGFGLNLGWEHRNLLTKAQKFTAETELRSNIQEITTNLSIPNYPGFQNTLSFYSNLVIEETDAFDSKSGTLGVEIAHKFQSTMTGFASVEVSNSDLEDVFRERELMLLSFPLRLDIDYRNDALNPTRGWAINNTLRPFFGIGSNENFVKSSITAQYYFPFDKKHNSTTLAFRCKLGTITGETLTNIPENIRFYAGGGGSIRGYGFQQAGLLSDTRPIGGLSIIETSLEARFRWLDHWGSALFIDGGSNFPERTPALDQELFWGAGFGIRYYTSFAPIRLDVAFPKRKRDGVDDPFHLYISIGEAF